MREQAASFCTEGLVVFWGLKCPTKSSPPCSKENSTHFMGSHLLRMHLQRASHLLSISCNKHPAARKLHGITLAAHAIPVQSSSFHLCSHTKFCMWKIIAACVSLSTLVVHTSSITCHTCDPKQGQASAKPHGQKRFLHVRRGLSCKTRRSLRSVTSSSCSSLRQSTTRCRCVL